MHLRGINIVKTDNYVSDKKFISGLLDGTHYHIYRVYQ